MWATIKEMNVCECVCMCRLKVCKCAYCLTWFLVMMQESRLTHLQKKRITDCLQSRFATGLGCIMIFSILYIKALRVHLLMVKITWLLLHLQKEQPYRWPLTPLHLLLLLNLKLSRRACQPGRRDAVLKLVAVGTLMSGKGSVPVPQVGSQSCGPPAKVLVDLYCPPSF